MAVFTSVLCLYARSQRSTPFPTRKLCLFIYEVMNCDQGYRFNRLEDRSVLCCSLVEPENVKSTVSVGLAQTAINVLGN